MTEIKREKLRVTPYFELEEFMNLAHETRLSTEAFEMFSRLWEEWSGLVEAWHIKGRQNSWIAVWLPEEVEKKTDEIWDSSPSEGFLVSTLAHYLCMAAIQELLPQAAEGGCAPAPKFTLELGSALREIGLADKGMKREDITRRFAVISYYPFKGGCEICDLSAECPRLKGSVDMPVMVLPGYERGVEPSS